MAAWENVIQAGRTDWNTGWKQATGGGSLSQGLTEWRDVHQITSTWLHMSASDSGIYLVTQSVQYT